MFSARYPTVECLKKDRDVLLTFCDFPAEHWAHLRMENPIESAFATVRAYHARAKCWHGHYPAAVQCVDRDLNVLLAVFDVPAEHCRLVRTSNGIERCFRGVRRRTRPIGMFVNDASIERINCGLMAYHIAKYATRICRGLKELERVA